MTSDTPRTDAMSWVREVEADGVPCYRKLCTVPVEFAETLERELNNAVALLNARNDLTVAGTEPARITQQH